MKLKRIVDFRYVAKLLLNNKKLITLRKIVLDERVVLQGV